MFYILFSDQATHDFYKNKKWFSGISHFPHRLQFLQTRGRVCFLIINFTFWHILFIHIYVPALSWLRVGSDDFQDPRGFKVVQS